MLCARLFRDTEPADGGLGSEEIPPDRIREVLASGRGLVWMDACSPAAGELDTLAGECGLHPLAIEDAMEGRQRPKADHYAHYLFLVLYTAELDQATGQATFTRVSAFVSDRYLLTVRQHPGLDVDELRHRWDTMPALLGEGTGYLLHGLVDLVVDGHAAVLAQLDDQIEALEDIIFDEQPRGLDVQRRSYEFRKSLVQIHRLLAPTRDAIGSVVRRDSDLVTPRLGPYYQDVLDHSERAVEESDSLRDLVSNIFDTHLTLQNNRANDVMKKVTSYAAIIAVPAAITGYYGMNVRTWPHADTLVGGIVALVLLVGLSGILWVTFKVRDWL